MSRHHLGFYLFFKFSFMSDNGVSGEKVEKNRVDDSLDRDILVSFRLRFLSTVSLGDELIWSLTLFLNPSIHCNWAFSINASSLPSRRCIYNYKKREKSSMKFSSKSIRYYILSLIFLLFFTLIEM
ncbi:hypothetical protein Bca4012_101884 [Brassica carinata]|uniref:(rape) hypothetical protein n=1 Tax=Brassica napus TaxID=3708 RepID=A0A816QV23_BRANA|nr:unnamed protein product [Brassica napus]